VLQGVLCEVIGNTLRATGTDLEMTVKTSLEVEAGEEGSVVIPGRLAAEAVRKLPAGPVTISSAEGEVEILGQGPKFRLRQLAVEDFPQLDEPPAGGVEVDGNGLAEAIRQVTIAASADAARPILTGVLFEGEGEGLRLVATDSYRLAVRDLAGAGLGGSGLIPARGLRELERTVGASKVSVLLEPREAVFRSDRGVLRLRLIEGAFPKYRTLLPDSYPNQISIDKTSLLEALGRAALVAEDHIPVRMKISNGGVELSVNRHDVGGETEHIEGDFKGAEEEVEIAFNPRYLADGVAAVDSERVRLQVIDGLKPSVIDSPDGGEFLYLLMPVRV